LVELLLKTSEKRVLEGLRLSREEGLRESLRVAK